MQHAQPLHAASLKTGLDAKSEQHPHHEHPKPCSWQHWPYAAFTALPPDLKKALSDVGSCEACIVVNRSSICWKLGLATGSYAMHSRASSCKHAISY